MTTTASVIAHSVSKLSKPIFTLECRYPRFIHAEVMTHRVFSRNANSSRAIPVARLIREIEEDPVMPRYWGKNQPGMQAREELDWERKSWCQEVWQQALGLGIGRARVLHNYGAHKCSGAQ